MKAKWEPHYTGIETWQLETGIIELYAQRDRRTKALEFLRVSNNYRPRWYRPYFNVHVFLRKTNYGGTYGRGFEFGAQLYRLHAGFGYARSGERGWKVRWSGSGVDPYRTCVVFFRHAFVMFDAPGWLRRIAERRAAAEWEAAEAAWWNSLTPEERAEYEAQSAYEAQFEEEGCE